MLFPVDARSLDTIKPGRMVLSIMGCLLPSSCLSNDFFNYKNGGPEQWSRATAPPPAGQLQRPVVWSSAPT